MQRAGHEREREESKKSTGEMRPPKKVAQKRYWKLVVHWLVSSMQ